MSGGSYDYAYFRISEMADGIESRLSPCGCDDPDFCDHEQHNVEDDEVRNLRRRFVALLRLVATAAHDIEWVDSYDYSPGEEAAAIRAALDFEQGGRDERE